MNEAQYESTDQLQDIYGVASDTSVSVIVEGMHGIGKSESVYQFCDTNNFHVEPLFLSHQEVADLIGIPSLTKDTKGDPVTIWSKPIWLVRLEENAKKGLRTALFLDELNRSQTEVRQAALQLVLDKQIHEHKLPKTIVDGVAYDCFIIAAINPADADYQVDELDPALMDRFLHYKLNVNVDSWLDWAIHKNVNKVIISYISNNKDKLNAPQPNASVYPTPRSWVKLSELLESYENKNINNQALLFNLITGKIGNAVGAQFLSFYKDHSVIVTVDDIKKTTDKIWKKTKGSDAERIIEVSESIAKMIEPLEIPLLKDLNKNMIEKFLKVDSKFTDAKPLIAFMHAVPVEQLTAMLKELQGIEEGILYKTLAIIDPEKQIFFKVLGKIKKLQK